MIHLLRADPHAWGDGHVHEFDLARGVALCGRSKANCPGKMDVGEPGAVTCASCLRARTKREREEERQERLEEWRRESEERQREWWRLYKQYLNSPQWAAKRRLVLQRDGHKCQGCLKSLKGDVAHAHHRRYPSGCWPGSPAWVRQEKLFDLISLCEQCHEDVHGRSFD